MGRNAVFLVSILEKINELNERGERFCVATVVRTADVTSAKAGAKAVITADGTIHGHLGGACVQTALKAAAAEVLSGTAPKMIRVKPSEKVVNLRDADGVEVFKSGCPSGGTVDVLIEACFPTPRLVVLGTGVVAEAVAQHGALMDFQMLVDPACPVRDHGTRVLSNQASELGGLTERDVVVVAAQGKGDLKLLEQAVDGSAGYIALVASAKKAAYLKSKLSEKGYSGRTLSRIKAPAGKDIGAIGPHEIAISILAEIIEVRRRSEKSDKPVTSHDDAAEADREADRDETSMDVEARLRALPICC